MHYQPLDTSSLQIVTPVLLKQGTRLLEPTVYRTHLDGQLAVVKDYSRYRRTLLAPIARLMVRPESKMRARLHGWRHAPALLGTLGGLA
ncbi:kinase, partial [Xanthomonas hortorum pv. gardneri]